MQKNLTLSFALLLLINISYGQFLKKIIPANNSSQSISNVVESYQNNYHSIQAEAITPDEDRDIFMSAIQLHGAQQAVIYRFHSNTDTSAGWQVLLFSGQEYKDAEKAYNNAYKTIKQSRFKVGNDNYGFEGEKVPATDAIRFTSSLLRPTINTGVYEHYMAQIDLIYSFDGWKVKLSLHSRKDDTERY